MAPRRKRGLTFEQVCRIGASFPGVEQATSYGTAALKVRGKLLVRLKEDGETLMLRAPFLVRDHLMRTAPEAFFITDHYRDYPAVLLRLALEEEMVVRQLIEDAWRAMAPKRLLAEYDQNT